MKIDFAKIRARNAQLSCLSEPLPLGTIYDGRRIVEVVECDTADDYQPHQYMLDDGELVWIPTDAKVELPKRHG